MSLGTWVRFTATFAAVAFLGTSANAANDPIAYWNFNTLAIPTVGTPAALGITSISPTTDTGASTLSLTNFAGNIDDFTGTGLNADTVNPIGDGNVSLSLLPAAGLVGNGGFLQFEFSMAGRTNFGVSIASQRTATGFNSNQWSYSTDGTNFTNFDSAINSPVGSYGQFGPAVTSALDNAATAYLRYTVSGGTNATGNNRLDNVQLLYNATPPAPPNAASLPQPGDIVFGLNNTSSATTLELVRGGVRYPGPWSSQGFIQSVEFDNLSGQRHNARGNLLGINFSVGGGANSGAIYSFATQGTNPAPAPQVIGNTGVTSPVSPIMGHTAGSLTQSSLAGLSVSPDNSKIAVVGVAAGTVIVYDYTAGDTMGAGAALANGRQTSSLAADRILPTGATQGSAWKDNNTVLAFSSIGDLYEVDATTMTPTFKANIATPNIGSNGTALAYNPDESPYLYALYSGFATAATPDSQTKLYVFDSANNYALLTDADGVDLSLSSQTGREIALDNDGNLLISAFDSTITYIPASAAQNPASITDNSSVFLYQSSVNASGFVGFDIGFGEAVGLTGDYNENGTVDAADYVLWRDNPAAFGGDPAGYNTWRANFGNTAAGSGSAVGAAAVPEPMGLVLLLVGVLGLGLGRRRG